MHQAKPVATPMFHSTKLTILDGSSFEDSHLYHSTVGSLQYLVFIRLDISFTVNRVCQYMHFPWLSHWQAVKRILRYLNHTQNYRLHFSPKSSFHLNALFDTDWAGCPDDRRSNGGFCIFFGHHLIFWSFKKQPIIARSSIKAEYKIVANIASELI